MVLLLTDGFDYVISGELIGTKWPQGSINLDTESPGRQGGRCLKLGDDNYYLRYNIIPYLTDHSLIIGCAIYANNWASGTGYSSGIIKFSNGSYDIVLNTTTAGTIRVSRYSGWIYETEPVLKTGVWHYLEAKCRIHNTNGILEVRIDGRTVIDITGDVCYGSVEQTHYVDLKGKYATDSRPTWFDDVYVLTDSGEAPTDFLGDCKVDTIYPSGVGTHAEMTPSSGENYECVDEVILDDTDYVCFSGENGLRDCYDFQDVSGETTIHGITVMRGCLLETGNVYSRPLLNVYGNLYSGEEEVIGGTLGYDNKIYVTDPESGEVWTNEKINKYEFGMITS